MAVKFTFFLLMIRSISCWWFFKCWTSLLICSSVSPEVILDGSISIDECKASSGRASNVVNIGNTIIDKNMSRVWFSVLRHQWHISFVPVCWNVNGSVCSNTNTVSGSGLRVNLVTWRPKYWIIYNWSFLYCIAIWWQGGSTCPSMHCRSFP